MREGIESRLADSVENALGAAEGYLTVVTVPREGEAREFGFSQTYACEEHGISFGELEPRMFSFNNPSGACPHCAGLGEIQSIAVERLIPNKKLSLSEGAIAVNGFKSLEEESWNGPLFAAVGKRHGFTMETPIEELNEEKKKIMLQEYFDGNKQW